MHYNLEITGNELLHTVEINFVTTLDNTTAPKASYAAVIFGTRNHDYDIYLPQVNIDSNIIFPDMLVLGI
jgi:hypothetical protein